MEKEVINYQRNTPKRLVIQTVYREYILCWLHMIISFSHMLPANDVEHNSVNYLIAVDRYFIDISSNNYPIVLSTWTSLVEVLLWIDEHIFLFDWFSIGVV